MFRPYIGFSSLGDFLESELQKRYKEAAPATLDLLEQRCSEVTARVGQNGFKNTGNFRCCSSAMLHTASISNHVGALIDGAAYPAPEQWGENDRGDARKSGNMDGYVGFHAALRHAYNRSIRDLAKQCKQLVRHHLDSVTSPYSQVCYKNDLHDVKFMDMFVAPGAISLQKRQMILQSCLNEFKSVALAL